MGQKGVNVIRRLQISNLSCTKHRDGTVDVDVRAGLQSVQLQLGAKVWNGLVENVVLFGALDVDVPRLRARLGDLRKAANGVPEARVVLDELEQLLDERGPEGHWHGCTLPPDHEGDCVVRRTR